MTVSLELGLWQIISLLVVMFGGYWTLAKILAGQVGRNIDQKFQSIATAQQMTAKEIEVQQRRQIELEKDLLKFMAALPLEYVRREDFIRNQTTIEAKLDGMAHSLQQMALTGKPR